MSIAEALFLAGLIKSESRPVIERLESELSLAASTAEFWQKQCKPKEPTNENR